MAAKRILAVLIAALLIVGAVFVRKALDDNPAPSAGPGTSEPAAPGDGTRRVLCVEDLRSVCEAFDAANDDVSIDIEPFAATIKKFTDRTFDADGWITFEPFNRYADDTWTSKPIAQTPIVAATPKNRPIDCTPLTWTCITEQRGDRSIGHSDPRTTAQGVLALGSIAVGAAGRSDLTSGDVDDDPTLSRVLTEVETSINSQALSAPSIFQFMSTRPAAVNIAVGFEAEIKALGLSASTQVNAPNPQTTARVIWLAAPGQNDRLAELYEDLASRLVAAQWYEATASEIGLPSAATLASLPRQSGL